MTASVLERRSTSGDWSIQATILQNDVVHFRRSCVIAVSLLLAVSGCGGGGGDFTACDRPFREQLDPNWELHPTSAAGIQYLTNPPTSGPHTVWFNPPGFALDGELNPLLQIGALESGLILVQYNDLEGGPDGIVTSTIRAAGSDDIMVSPNAGIDLPVVATASQWKMNCPDVTPDNVQDVVGDIETFFEERSSSE